MGPTCWGRLPPIPPAPRLCVLAGQIPVVEPATRRVPAALLPPIAAPAGMPVPGARRQSLAPPALLVELTRLKTRRLGPRVALPAAHA
jgi:hypothetical protein